MNLDYGSPTANAALRSMREDLPVRGEGTIAKTYTEHGARVARAARALREAFTRADVVDLLQERHGADAPDDRTVRRHLSELASAGYLERDRDGAGTAYQYEHRESPGSGEVVTPELPGPPPGQTLYEPHYTASVRVVPLDDLLERDLSGVSASGAGLPAPSTLAEGGTDGPPPE